MNTVDDILAILKNPKNYYLTKQKDNIKATSIPRVLGVDDMYFVKMKSVTFEEDAPRQEALANVLSSMRLPYINFVYLIVGDKKQVSFYYGVSKDLFTPEDKTPQNIKEVGAQVLTKGIEGNFRGSNLQLVEPEASMRLMESLGKYQEMCVLEGVPGLNEDDASDFQGVDRLIDVMLGDEFAFLVTAKWLPIKSVLYLEDRIFDLYEKLSPSAKITIQKSKSEGVSYNATSTKGTNKSDSSSSQTSKQKGVSSSTGKTSGHSFGDRDDQTSSSQSGSKTDSTSSTQGTSTSNTVGTSESIADSKGKNEGKSATNSTERVVKVVSAWMNYIDDPVLERIDYGKGKGVFAASITMLANNDVVLRKIANTATSLFSGETGNNIPLSYSKNVLPEQRKALLNLQVPVGSFIKGISDVEVMTRASLSQYVTRTDLTLANWLTVKELGIVAGLPKKEVVGLSLNEEVEFGLNLTNVSDSQNEIPLGDLVKSGVAQNGLKVSLDRKDLNKHIFICGVTGSGKTTTCMGLLKNSNLPFLVIEPAKTEYRILANHEKDVLVFTLGRDDVAPFRLNPLEFLPGESISSHVDMLMASITAAFDMEAAIPQVIESSLYECYKRYGWNINTNKNSNFEDPFAPGVYSFPTLADLINMTEEIVTRQGFSDRLKDDYLGSVRARLLGLVVGAKGSMLNTPRSVDFRTLIHRKVVLELENVKSVSEKSLIMGFILSSLNEAIKVEHRKNNNFQHITLVEEAHRLLSRFTPGDSLNKKNGVEMFSDMLAEIRKYGESLIIADQIPDKMTPEVLKNTNTKIVHKIFAQDDKDAMGNTMSLTKEQKSFLSNLPVGRAVVFSQGWEKSVMTQVDLVYNTTNEFIKEQNLHDKIIDYYSENYQSGIFPSLLMLDKKPSRMDVEYIWENFDIHPVIEEFKKVMNKGDSYRMKPDYLQGMLKKLVAYYSIPGIARVLSRMSYFSIDEELESLVASYLSDALNCSFPSIDEFRIKYKSLKKSIK